MTRATVEASERGVKRRCSECDAPFYDMQRSPIRCPKCGAEHDAEAGKKKLASVPRPPRSRTSRGGRAAPGFETPAPEHADVGAASTDGAPEPLTGNDGDGDEMVEGDD